jgi:hypothetical protein
VQAKKIVGVAHSGLLLWLFTSITVELLFRGKSFLDTLMALASF